MIRIITSLKTLEWDEIVGSFKFSSIYQLNAYANSFKIHGDGEPILFYFENDEMKAINVTMKRPISEMCQNISLSFDLASPYGYGGPIFEGNITENNLLQFSNEYHEICAQENIVSEFIRFDPCINNIEPSKHIFDVAYAGENVVWYLDEPDSMWINMDGKNRNVIRKAKSANIKIEHGLNERLIEDFIPLYNSTMDYDHARDYYYFRQEYYQYLLENFKDKLEIFTAKYENEIVAMAMVFKFNKKLHYHLSAFNREFSKFAPNNLLLFEVAIWGYQNGYELFQLGGGVGGASDGLLKFKKSFTNQTTKPFYIGKVIHDLEKYNYFVNLLTDSKESNYFPLYRSSS